MRLLRYRMYHSIDLCWMNPHPSLDNVHQTCLYRPLDLRHLRRLFLGHKSYRPDIQYMHCLHCPDSVPMDIHQSHMLLYMYQNKTVHSHHNYMSVYLYRCWRFHMEPRSYSIPMHLHCIRLLSVLRVHQMLDIPDAPYSILDCFHPQLDQNVYNQPVHSHLRFFCPNNIPDHSGGIYVYRTCHTLCPLGYSRNVVHHHHVLIRTFALQHNKNQHSALS